MADDRYNWLDKDTAERLLRGEPVGARHGDGARELEQLLQAAAAVGAKVPETVELPGEEAAMAAFRRTAGRGSAAHTRSRGADEAFGGGRSTAVAERARFGRPVRRGFAVALAACAIGGVAVAAGTGVLPTPFRGGEPEPASSVSAPESPGPLDTREPGAQTDGTTESTPDPTSSGQAAGPGTPAPGSSPGATTPGGTPGTGHQGTGGTGGNSGHGDKKNLLLALCQSYDSGKRDTLDRDALHRLEQKAGGPDKILAFCRAYLARYQHLGNSGGGSGLGGATGGTGSTSGVTGGDEDDEGHPSQSPGATPPTGTSSPAPAPSATATDPGNATPSTAPAT
ncbi:hypothetical protein AB0G85_01465 [Streptomyces sioyaensis]|uniref:hypothetical protein n=1 Tax=Streptomyces sioyaensis TaxID=67364 RepID=UPI0033E19800